MFKFPLEIAPFVYQAAQLPKNAAESPAGFVLKCQEELRSLITLGLGWGSSQTLGNKEFQLKRTTRTEQKCRQSPFTHHARQSAFCPNLFFNLKCSQKMKIKSIWNEGA